MGVTYPFMNLVDIMNIIEREGRCDLLYKEVREKFSTDYNWSFNELNKLLSFVFLISN